MSDLLSDLKGILDKHGLKGDGDTPSVPNGGGEKPKAPETPKGTNPEVIADISDRIAEKLANAIIANKHITNPTEKEDLNDHIKAKIFTNWGGLQEISYPSDIKTLSKEEKIVTFFKALMYAKADPQSDRVLRALVEGTDTEGGYLVPEELRAEVFRVLPDMSVMRRIARVIPMTTNSLKLNTLTARPTAYWTAEYASKSTTSAEFGQVELVPNDLVCLLPVSEQLVADANINIVQFIIELFAEAIGLEEDKAFFTGSGTGRPRGISIETIASQSAGASLDFDDIIDLIDLVPQRASQGPRAAFVANRVAKRLLRKVKDSDGQYIWREGGGRTAGETGRLPDTVYGYPFYEQNDLSQDELYFGDWGYYIIGDRQTLSVRTTTEGGDAWRRNAVEIKAVERVDGRTVLTSPFAKLTDV